MTIGTISRTIILVNSFGKIDLVKEAWVLFKKNLNLFALLVGVYIVYYLVNGLFSNSVILSLLLSIVSIILEIGSINLVLKLVDGNKGDIKDVYTYSNLPIKVFKTFVACIFAGIAIVGGLILLVIPGIYVAVRLQFFTYYIVDKDAGVMDALKMSWNLTKNGKLNLFLFDLLLVLLNFGGALLLGVGLLLTLPLSLAAMALLYRKFQK